MSIPNNVQKPNFGENEGVWEYLGINGDHIGYIVRYKPQDGKRKYFLPFTFQEGNWVNKWLADNKAPLYNAHLLKSNLDKDILIVEGEKTADAASLIFTEYLCMTWKGGAQAIKNINVELLEKRRVVLWPDNDASGINAMNDLHSRLIGIADKIVKINPTIYKLDVGWDLADFNDHDSVIDLSLLRQTIEDGWNYVPKILLINKEEFPYLSTTTKILNSYENIEYLLNFYKIVIKYNEIKKDIEVDIPHKNFTKANKAKLILAELRSLCIKNNVPTSDIADWVLMLADQNNYNPVYDFLNESPWDGISRIPEFLDTIICENIPLRDMLVNKWMIGAIATGLSKIGLAHQGVLTLCGPQYCGKSSWFCSLMPDHPNLTLGDHSLTPTDKDSVRTATRFWLTELSEVDGAVRKSDVSSMKSFLTRKLDVYRCPYDRADTEAPRNTAFVATVNDPKFLRDSTGNRRWWVLDVKSLNAEHNMDMQQVWAEYYNLFLSGASQFLDKDEFSLLNASNMNHTVKPSIDELIRERYLWEEDQRLLRKSATQVLVDCGIDLGGSDKTKMINDCHQTLRELTNGDPKMIKGVRIYYLPPLNAYFGR